MSALSEHHEVIAPTALGHRGGAPVESRPVEIRSFVEEVERLLDKNGWDTAHFAGNSLGGWVALELARKGRARTVCALSPAGFWTAHGTGHAASAARIAAAATLARRTRPLAPVGFHLPLVRQLTFRTIAGRGDRLTPAQALGIVDDLLGCTVTEELLATREQIASMPVSPCPITVAWSGCDRVFPQQINGRIAVDRLPQAQFETLPNVGHVPMIDDPDGVTRVILATTARSSGAVSFSNGDRVSGESGIAVVEAGDHRADANAAQAADGDVQPCRPQP